LQCLGRLVLRRKALGALAPGRSILLHGDGTLEVTQGAGQALPAGEHCQPRQDLRTLPVSQQRAAIRQLGSAPISVCLAIDAFGIGRVRLWFDVASLHGATIEDALGATCGAASDAGEQGCPETERGPRPAAVRACHAPRSSLRMRRAAAMSKARPAASRVATRSTSSCTAPAAVATERA